MKHKVKLFSTKKTVRVYHTTKISNLPSIFKFGILRKFQKDRDFENKSLELNLTSRPFIYLSKNLEHLCIPAVEGKRVVLQIDIPKDIFTEWNKKNRGDPMYNWFMANKYKFNGSWMNFIHYMIREMCKQDPKLKFQVEKEIKEYGSIERTPRFIHGVNSIEAMKPENCLCVEGDIDPNWILKRVLTEKDLNQREIYFGKLNGNINMKYFIKRFSATEKKDNKRRIIQGSLAAGLGGSTIYAGKYIGGKINKSALETIAETKVDPSSHRTVLQRITSPDIAISQGMTKDFDKAGWNAIPRDHYDRKFTPEQITKLGNTKAAVEIGDLKRQTLATTAHELGHAEHLAGRGTRVGRIAHKVYHNLPVRGMGLGAVAGITAGALTKDDNTSTASAMGIGAAAGLLGSSPEIIMEHSANKEGLKLLKNKAHLNDAALDLVKKSYKKQLRGRIAQRLLPAAGIGAATALATKSIKRRNKNET